MLPHITAQAASNVSNRPAQLVINSLPQYALVQVKTLSGNTYRFVIIDGSRGEAVVFNERLQKYSHCIIVCSRESEGGEFPLIIRAGCELILRYDEEPDCPEAMSRVTEVDRLRDDLAAAELMIAQLDRKIESASDHEKGIFIEQFLERLLNECGSIEGCEKMHRLVAAAAFPDGQLELVNFLGQSHVYGILPLVISSLYDRHQQYLLEEQQRIVRLNDTGKIIPFFGSSWNPADFRPPQNPTVAGHPPAFVHV